jgi:DNA-binding protein YbaB
VEEGDHIFVIKMYPEDTLDERDAEHLHDMGSMATKLAAAAHEAKGAKTLEECSRSLLGGILRSL